MTMLQEPGRKYRPFQPIDLPDRQWPGRTITHPPRWLSTDLRDGNQAIVDPMDAVKKNRFFDLLLEIGVKEIEIGFPAAGQTEFDFIQGLVHSGKIPDDVIVQVLTQARADLIKRSFESLDGARAEALEHSTGAHRPHDAGDPMAGGEQCGDYAPPDDAGGSSDHDVHDQLTRHAAES